MATRKTKVVEKIISSEDRIKGNALYFLQGTDLRLEIFDPLSYLRTLEGLSAEEKLKHLEGLDMERVSPKLGIITVDEAGGEKRHVNVPLNGARGLYVASIPDLYPRDGADKYVICDTVHVKKSFTKEIHDRWEEHHANRELGANLARQSEIRREVRKTIPSSEEIKSIRQQLPELRKTQKSLAEKQAAMFNDLNASPEDVEKVVARLDLLTDRIKSLEAKVDEWENSNDPFAKALEASGLNRELGKLSDQTNLAFLEFVHALSLEDGRTDETFEEWKAKATAEDYANAIEVVGEGNAFWTYGGSAKALSREEERRRSLESLVN